MQEVTLHHDIFNRILPFVEAVPSQIHLSGGRHFRKVAVVWGLQPLSLVPSVMPWFVSVSLAINVIEFSYISTELAK